MSATVKGLWSRAELTQAFRLAKECEATDARWAFADWLLTKDGGGSYHAAIAGPRLVALETKLGWPFGTLRRMRQTAYAWPPEYRVAEASFSTHEQFRTGGPAKAPERAAELAARQRTASGRIVRQQQDRLPTVHLCTDVHAALKAEARVTGTTIQAVVNELLREALEARVWLADELAA